MHSKYILFITALAPLIWGSTYYVTTEFLPANYPLTVSMLRALPAGLLLLILVRRVPKLSFLPKILVLGTLNFSIFWWLLFIAAYRLPGGVAATVGAIQPLLVIVFAHLLLGSTIQLISIFAAFLGLCGIGVLILTPSASLDAIGISAGLSGAVAMALGTVLSRRWQPNETVLTFTAWQLLAGGLVLLPFSLWLEPPLPDLSVNNIMGLSYLCIAGAAVSYILWFKGVATLSPASISTLTFISPIIAVIIGWALLDQSLNNLQLFAMAIILFSIWVSQHNNYKNRKFLNVFDVFRFFKN